MRILILDDHRLFLDGIRYILKMLDPNAVVHEYTQAEEALKTLDSGERFDLVLIDLHMPGIDGISLLRRLHNAQIRHPLVIVSAAEEIGVIAEALKLGAMGFIPKTYSSEQMLSALTTVLAGNIYIPESLQKKIELSASRRKPSPEHPTAAVNNNITKRQLEVLQLMEKGLSNQQIAEHLFLSLNTVKVHIQAVFSVLQTRNRVECILLAKKKGILVDDK